MPIFQPQATTIHIDRLMTDFSIGYEQDEGAFVAGRVFPIVPVKRQSDRYVRYKKEALWRDSMKKRAPGTLPAIGGWEVDITPTYRCEEWALGTHIVDEDRTNVENPITLDEDATIYLTQQALLRREKFFVAKFLVAGFWGQTSGANDWTGVAAGPVGNQFVKWSVSTSTPTADVKAVKRSIQQTSGVRPNVMTMTRNVYDTLTEHPNIIARINAGQTPGGPARVTKEHLTALFEVDEINVMDGIENTADEGATLAMNFLTPSTGAVLLSYRPKRVGLRTITSGITLMWDGLMDGMASQGRVIRRFRSEEDEKAKRDYMDIFTAFDQVAPAPETAALLLTVI